MGMRATAGQSCRHIHRRRHVRASSGRALPSFVGVVKLDGA